MSDLSKSALLMVEFPPDVLEVPSTMNLIRRLAAEIEALEAENARVMATLAEYVQREAALEAEVATLREALGPFAATGQHYNPATPDDDNPSPSIWCSELTVGDLRRAAEAMKGKA